MSDLAILVLCLTGIVITSIISGTWYSLHKVDPIEEARKRLIDAGNRLHRDLERSYEELEPDPEIETPAEPESMEPVPFDPENPPRPRVYSRRPESTAPAPRCFCHDREVRSGQTVLWWPVPDSEAVRIYCQKEDS